MAAILAAFIWLSEDVWPALNKILAKLLVVLDCAFKTWSSFEYGEKTLLLVSAEFQIFDWVPIALILPG